MFEFCRGFVLQCFFKIALPFFVLHKSPLFTFDFSHTSLSVSAELNSKLLEQLYCSKSEGEMEKFEGNRKETNKARGTKN